MRVTKFSELTTVEKIKIISARKFALEVTFEDLTEVISKQFSIDPILEQAERDLEKLFLELGREKFEELNK